MTIIIFSLLLIFIYFLTIFLVIFIKKNKKIKFFQFPNLKIDKQGIYFNSTKTHRIELNNVKFLQINNTVYLKHVNDMIIINNVKDVILQEKHLYFTGLGEVKIIFKTEDIYRYFNIIIKSKNFNLRCLKQAALKDIINNLFDMKNCKKLKKYLNFVKNILKININNEKIIINKNKFNFCFDVFYKINNTIKHVKVDKTF